MQIFKDKCEKLAIVSCLWKGEHKDSQRNLCLDHANEANKQADIIGVDINFTRLPVNSTLMCEDPCDP